MGSGKYLDATIVLYIDGRHEFKKYRKIKDTESRLEKFERFARSTFPQADYINYYWNDSSKYAFRRYLTPQGGHLRP
jgi:hypothetical protein